MGLVVRAAQTVAKRIEPLVWNSFTRFCDMWFRALPLLTVITLVVYSWFVIVGLVQTHQLRVAMIGAAVFLFISVALLQVLHHRPAKYGPHQ